MPAVLIIDGVSMTSTVLLKKIIIGPVFKKKKSFHVNHTLPCDWYQAKFEKQKQDTLL